MEDEGIGDDIGEIESSDEEYNENALNQNVDVVEDDETVEMDNIPDDANLVFDKHTGSVFCCDLTSNGELAVSGGEDDRAYVWNTSTGEVIFECQGYSDSVTCVCFNSDNSMLAAGDMSGVIIVWKLSTKENIWSYSTGDLLWLKWHPVGNVLLGGSADGNIYMWDISSDNPQNCVVFAGRGSSPECCTILSNEFRMAVGYGDGSICIWNLKSNAILHRISAHAEKVICIENHSGEIILSGSSDGTARLINANNGRVLRAMSGASYNTRDDQIRDSVESVGFCQTLPLFAIGSLNGNLGIWDLSSQIQRQNCVLESGIIRLIWDHQSPLLYTCDEEGIVKKWDARDGTCVAQWLGHNDKILDMKLSNDGNFILTASDDKTCRIFRLNEPDR
ncbi:hypothetical protein CHUAL_000456 [Chamberlinius hualienensis]